MLTFEEQVKLIKAASKADRKAPVAYSYNGENFSGADVQDLVRNELNELAGNYNLYRKNKTAVFELLEIGINEYLPKQVMAQFEQFAEVRTLKQGEKAIFTQKVTDASRRRAKKFVTHVGLAGRYETFKLDGRSYEVPTNAIGGAVRIEFEEMLDGRVDLSELLAIVAEGMTDLIREEIVKALESLATTLPVTDPNNFVSANGFVEQSMDRLLKISDAYSSNGKSTIYCTFAFAAKMLPQNAWQYSERMKEEAWNNGYFANYKGHNVVILEQSFKDIDNAEEVVNDQLAYIFPAGAEKPVKVVYEGTAHVREVEEPNDDWSRDIQMYTKVGVGLITETHHVCVYQDLDL